jgi:predicted anti-sigma-YlaC factor YlaD
MRGIYQKDMNLRQACSAARCVKRNTAGKAVFPRKMAHIGVIHMRGVPPRTRRRPMNEIVGFAAFLCVRLHKRAVRPICCFAVPRLGRLQLRVAYIHETVSGVV